LAEVRSCLGRKAGGLAVGRVEQLLAHVPVVAIASHRRVLLAERDISGDGPVEEVERVAAQDVRHRGGK
jgi:hypothetical protein